VEKSWNLAGKKAGKKPGKKQYNSREKSSIIAGKKAV